MENNIHIDYLHETWLNDRTQYNIKNFTTITKDKKDRRGGGNAFLIRDTVKNKILSFSEDTDNTEVQALEVFIPEHTFALVNVYHPDKFIINPNRFRKIS
ncbi:hypothetical protein TNCT_580271 [Trichonephila clavata]|uniref:Uncharacterized protein n=1 Tax=Trichonephila clavata TaxID=2740835 RepID=A0A8X6L3L2_TRICU|nr:hypothetical protein TNCT_580271 [Trichonephila clavata]